MTSAKADSDVNSLTAAKALAGDPDSFGQSGSLEVRLSRNAQEIDAAQKLRYHVFYEEMSAKPDAETLARKRDFDRFDDFCDHLLVIDHKLGDSLDAVVGCYRLLRQDVAEKNGGFYTASEYDIAPLLERAGPNMHFLELGRSCVLPPYRNKPTVELLWQGIIRYLSLHNLDVMFGCASFNTINPDEIALPLAYLHHEFSAPPEWHVRALPDRYVEMNRMAKEEVNAREAIRAVPPMIKGYLRAGCYIGDGAVVDEQFGTTDVLIIFPVSKISERYLTKWAAKFGAPPEKN